MEVKMSVNGIGPLVRQFVHERNAARQAARSGEPAPVTAPPQPGTPAELQDSADLSEAALARFAAWKARHGAPEPAAPLPATPDAGASAPASGAGVSLTPPVPGPQLMVE
jgi:hypothetical protein